MIRELRFESRDSSYKLRVGSSKFKVESSKSLFFALSRRYRLVFESNAFSSISVSGPFLVMSYESKVKSSKSNKTTWNWELGFYNYKSILHHSTILQTLLRFNCNEINSWRFIR
jgi:hypothetical protein